MKIKGRYNLLTYIKKILQSFHFNLTLSEITIVSVKIKKINRPKCSKSGSIKSLIGVQKKDGNKS